MSIVADRRTALITGAAMAALGSLMVFEAAAQTGPAANASALEPKPLVFDPTKIKGMSEQVLTSHYENNSLGAVKRLSQINNQLGSTDFDKAPGFLLNGLTREQLMAWNSMILHELFFAGLGEASQPGPGLTQALQRDFGSVDRWRSELVANGKALGGGSGWVLLTWSARDRRLVNQ